ncbi:MAG: OmpH family outer membrane protein [Pseudomonadota bacterium]
MSFMKQQLLKVTLGLALVTAFAMPASAQETKIGVVNLQYIVQNAPQTRAVMDALREEFAPREREIVAKQKEFEDMQAKAQTDAAVMGETERRNMEKDLRDLQRDLQRLGQEYQEDLNLRQNEELAALQRTLVKEVQDYAEAQGYDVIVGDGVLYVSTAANITEAVLATVTANYQASAQ